MNDELARELEFLRDIGYTHLDLNGKSQSEESPSDEWEDLKRMASDR